MAGRSVRGGFLQSDGDKTTIVPIIEAQPVAKPAATTPRTPEIEIDFGGTVVRVATGVDTKTLTAVLRAMRATASL